MGDLLWIERGLSRFSPRQSAHALMPASLFLFFDPAAYEAEMRFFSIAAKLTIAPIMSTLFFRPDAEARERLILWIKKRMDACGITLAALQRSLEEDLDQTRYQDAFGNCWNGKGSLPAWLQRVVAAGQSIEHFRSENAEN
ncbi:hypothetical protein [Paraburkholderia phytofirmans]|uniref:hypothetical protein n=1 Tax=Paraburkholderia phytofirmans TaxID=261302 RepID=UPI0038B6E657